MKKIKVILSVLLMAAAISFTACSNASSGSDSDKTEKEDKKTEAPKPASGNGSGSGSGSGSQTKTYIGTKAPSEAKEVGDIIFSDGSATPGKNVKRLTDAQKKAEIAVIFYTGTDLNSDDSSTNRTLGLGLKLNKNPVKWCNSEAYGYNNISEIQCLSAINDNTLIIQGDKNGSDNFEVLAQKFKSVSSTPIDDADYPAFQYANNYSTEVENSGIFNTNWFLPSIAELYQLYVNGIGAKKTFDIDNILDTLAGNKFGNSLHWSSSQTENITKAYVFNFENGTLESKSKEEALYYTCAIHDFSTYKVTTNSNNQITITADKKAAFAGEKVTLSYTPAASDDYEIIFKKFIVKNGTEILNIEDDYSFVMPAGDVTITADYETVPLYSITISSAIGGSVTANKEKGIKQGETITLTVTPDVDNCYKLKSLSVMKGDTPVTFTNNSFTMPASNVTITAVFEVKIIGTKMPSAEKEVGDIVFNDGSSMPYSYFEQLSEDEQKAIKNSAIALIFYKGNELNSDKEDGTPDTSKTRTLGVGLIHKNKAYTIKWCKGTDDGEKANACALDIIPIRCEPVGSEGNYTFKGDKNGSDNLKQISDFLKAAEGVEDDTGTEGNYPAFDFAKNYKDAKVEYESSSRIISGSKFETGWYIPSIAELYQIWNCREDSTNGFDIDTASAALGGSKFGKADSPNSEYLSSSQVTGSKLYPYAFCFKIAYCYHYRNKYYGQRACCIREF